MNMIVQLLLLVSSFASFDTTQKQDLKYIEGADLKTRWDAALKDARSNHPRKYACRSIHRVRCVLR